MRQWVLPRFARLAPGYAEARVANPYAAGLYKEIRIVIFLALLVLDPDGDLPHIAPLCIAGCTQIHRRFAAITTEF